MDDLLKEFVVECNEGLSKLDQDLVLFEKNPADTEVLKRIFRVLHSVKGTGGMLGLARLERVAHAAEDVLSKIRDNQLTLKTGTIGLILRAVDAIKMIMAALETVGKEPDGDDEDLVAALRAVYEGALPDSTVDLLSAARNVPAETQARSMSEQSLRVHVDVLDQLMNLVGELVLTRNQLVELVRGDDESKYLNPIQQLNRITSGLQESVMRTRMQPIGNAWSKLPRIVRDLVSDGHKQIELVMNGQETEIDRQVLQAIQDPLVHCVRNSCDHGIETSEERVKRGKPAFGTINLNAFHEGGHIVIEIDDDGGGINAEKVKQRALQRGILTPESAAQMSDQQIVNLIFEPGFSTAEKVTEISGRGVGMDVVRTNVEQIGGTVEVHSIDGFGATVRIKIPLTLAIVSALIVKVGRGDGATFAIPQVGVVELVRISDANQYMLEKINSSRVLRLRNRLLPLIDLGAFLGQDLFDESGEFSVVVAQVNNVQFGLIVNEIFDTQEIVVKPVGRTLREINLFAGSTILGDGRVIIILDLARIAARTEILGGVENLDSTPSGTGSSDEKSLGAEEASLLLCRVGDLAPVAVPLALVARLEEFKSSDLEEVDGRVVVQYRDGLLPLLTVDGHVLSRSGDGRVPTVIFSDCGHALGLAVSEVLDIVDTDLSGVSKGRKKGVLGSIVIREKATELIDTNYYLRRAYPELGEEARAQQGPSRRILLVEDSKFFQSLICPVLESSGYQVITAEDGLRALEELQAGVRPDIILSDIEMPNMDGYQLAMSIRADGRWSGIPLIALTSLSTEAAKLKALNAGFIDFMTKFDRQVLLNILKHHLDGSAYGQGDMKETRSA